MISTGEGQKNIPHWNPILWAKVSKASNRPLVRGIACAVLRAFGAGGNLEVGLLTLRRVRGSARGLGVVWAQALAGCVVRRLACWTTRVQNGRAS